MTWQQIGLSAFVVVFGLAIIAVISFENDAVQSCPNVQCEVKQNEVRGLVDRDNGDSCWCSNTTKLLSACTLLSREVYHFRTCLEKGQDSGQAC